ncbi:glycosyl hydrolase [Algibacillus agarilyticus]|uniref:glycosyl hydrolase n=1 Tax=Algibacillus agarilyticus TaxID=2234133 RepID=UPI001E35B2EC|nr:glycosyl hydrolase [Algibacillus agarilyticus]
MHVLRNTITSFFYCLLSLTLLIGCSDQSTALNHKPARTFDANSTALLQQQFMTPADEYKPLTWYHVMNGNMSKEGITADLESMAEVGIGGTILFNIGIFMSKGPVVFNSPKHLELIGHMASESKRLGLSFGIHNCDGWSSSGGPWITPELSMKKVTWSETVVNVPENQAGTSKTTKVQLSSPMALQNYYQDIAVLAYPSLDSEVHDSAVKPTITASDPETNIALLSDQQETEYTWLNAKGKQPVWLQFSYQQPVTVRFASLNIFLGKRHKYEFQSSNDGVNFTKHEKMTVRRPGKNRYKIDHNLEGITAKYFRIVMDKSIRLYEADLFTTDMIGNPLGRSSGARTDFAKFPKIGNPDAKFIVPADQIRNLSADMNSKGQLTTSLPAGNWTILRFGYTSTGVKNLPATDAGKGLEVDKYSRSAFKHHYEHYVRNVINQTKKVASGALHSIEIDSYEVGGQNWTQGYAELFEQKYGYDLIHYLPLYAGKFIDSATTSQDVLWDTRDLNNQLASDNYYGYFTELANKDGLTTYIEPYGFGPFNDLDVASKADIPMGEFWLKSKLYMIASSTSAAHIYNKNIISAESFTAGKQHSWVFNPAYGKLDGDRNWAFGINQFVFHRFAHQPNSHVLPGMTMADWGANIDRTQPWWDTAGKAWMSYIRRGQYLLRQGLPVADLLWYVGDAAPTTCPDRKNITKKLPNYINYDCVNREKLQTELSFKNGRYYFDHGVKYKALYLTNHDTLYLDSVKKIYQLALQGGVIIGEPIKRLAGRNITAQQQQQFDKMVNFIWSQPTTYRTANWDKIYQDNNLPFDLRIKDKDHAFYAHRTLGEQDIYFVYNDEDNNALFDLTANVGNKSPALWNANTGKITPLAAYETNENFTQVAFNLAAGESTFVVFSALNKDETASLPRVDPSLTRDHGVDAIYNQQNQIELRTTENISAPVPVTLNGQTKEISLNRAAPPQILTGNWQVSFNKKYGFDKTLTFNELTSWKDSDNDEVRAYSGTAVYQQSFELNAELVAAKGLRLDLGQVYDSAKVTLNGKDLGVSWMAPHHLDVTGIVQAGTNYLTVEVANTWLNRLITDEAYPDTSGFFIKENKKEASGYAAGFFTKEDKKVAVMPKWYTNNQPKPASKRFSFVTNKLVTKDDPLIDAGLVGPVVLRATSATIVHH